MEDQQTSDSPRSSFPPLLIAAIALAILAAALGVVAVRMSVKQSHQRSRPVVSRQRGLNTEARIGKPLEGNSCPRSRQLAPPSQHPTTIVKASIDKALPEPPNVTSRPVEPCELPGSFYLHENHPSNRDLGDIELSEREQGWLQRQRAALFRT